MAKEKLENPSFVANEEALWYAGNCEKNSSVICNKKLGPCPKSSRIGVCVCVFLIFNFFIFLLLAALWPTEIPTGPGIESEPRLQPMPQLTAMLDP